MKTTVPVSGLATPVPPRRHLGLGPEEEAPRVLGREVHAAVALRLPEHVVPVGAVEGIAILEILDVGTSRSSYSSPTTSLSIVIEMYFV